MPTSIGFQPIGNSIVSRRRLERLADVDPRLTRSHYFDNRLLTDRDLNRDQTYLDGRLREVGQALGYGIMRGLEVAFDSLSGEITVESGIAISSAGRILELSQSLTLDTSDRGALVDLNNGRHRRLTRGLYAVVLQYAELPTDVAEVFPTDLGTDRGFDYDVVTEGVRIALVPLSLSLAVQNPLHVRANLMAMLSKEADVTSSIPEDGVALGVLAVSDDRPQWLDSELLRQPLRTSLRPGDAQRDLWRQYEKLFSELMTYRREGSLSGDFAAIDHFSVIPPVGPLPKDSIDPVSGRQSFFPESFQVSVAPIRRAELDLILEESLVLPSIDLSLEDAHDIVVLAPLNSTDYGRFAQRLESPINVAEGFLPKLNLLRLRLYPRPPVHRLDTDAATWQAIWDTVQEDDLVYVRRPVRVAETSTSAIVLARGVDVPPPPPTPSPTPAPITDTEPTPAPIDDTGPTPVTSPSDGPIVLDEDSVFLNRINLRSLIELRPPSSTDGQNAAQRLDSNFSNDANIAHQVAITLVQIEVQYDAVLWQTIFSLARSSQLREFNRAMEEGRSANRSTIEIIRGVAGQFNFEPALIDQWRRLSSTEL